MEPLATEEFGQQGLGFKFWGFGQPAKVSDMLECTCMQWTLWALEVRRPRF